ncbi:MAG: hypothetical protein R3D52_13340 [Xanthobacteraceae bacterium]
MRVYYDRDADVNLIKGKKVVIVGYGSQGHAHALDLRDSGVRTWRWRCARAPAAPRKPSRKARRLAFPRPPSGRTSLMMLTPDELQGDIPSRPPRRQHEAGRGADVRMGSNIHFNLIEPRPDLDVILIAPKGPGHTVRAEYQPWGRRPC